MPGSDLGPGAKEHMGTDWQLIRELMNSVIDACEVVEKLELTPDERELALEASPASVWDALQSSWTYPENTLYEVIRARHQLGIDKPFTPESARAIVQSARVCAEIVGAGEAESIQEPVRKLSHWYSAHMVPQINSVLEKSRKEPGHDSVP
jgi:hypothetical protein